MLFCCHIAPFVHRQREPIRKMLCVLKIKADMIREVQALCCFGSLLWTNGPSSKKYLLK